MENKEEELNPAQEQAILIAEEIFENSWSRMKQETEGISKKEACKYSFIMGFLNYLKLMDIEASKLQKEIKENPSKFQEVIEKFEGKLKEN